MFVFLLAKLMYLLFRLQKLNLPFRSIYPFQSAETLVQNLCLKNINASLEQNSKGLHKCNEVSDQLVKCFWVSYLLRLKANKRRFSNILQFYFPSLKFRQTPKIRDINKWRFFSSMLPIKYPQISLILLNVVAFYNLCKIFMQINGYW